MSQHGILASAWCWLVNTDGLAPAITLWEHGHDVWLGNSRGNTFGLNHTSIKVHSKEFWNYTFEEMAEHDVPATVDYILNHTQTFFEKDNVPQLQYIGWSQGTTAMFIGGVSSRAYTTLSGEVTTVSSFLETSVAHFIALSPVVYLEHTTSGLLKFMADTGVGELAEVCVLGGVPCVEARLTCSLVLDVSCQAAFPYDFLSGSNGLSLLEHFVCDITVGVVCKISVDWICGSSFSDSKAVIDDRFVKHFPAGELALSTSIAAVAVPHTVFVSRGCRHLCEGH